MSVVDLGADALYGRLGEVEFDVKELLAPPDLVLQPILNQPSRSPSFSRTYTTPASPTILRKPLRVRRLVYLMLQS